MLNDLIEDFQNSFIDKKFKEAENVDLHILINY